MNGWMVNIWPPHKDWQFSFKKNPQKTTHTQLLYIPKVVFFYSRNTWKGIVRILIIESIFIAISCKEDRSYCSI